MSFRLGDPGHLARAGRSPKIARLHALAQAGLPVPAGVVLDQPVLAEADAGPIAALLAAGPVIVRSAYPDEDGDSASWAGLGLSVVDCADLDAVARAMEEIGTHHTATWSSTGVGGYGGDARSPQVLLQTQIERAWLLVCVWTPEGAWYVEAHDAAGDVLATGESPAFAGPLDVWDHVAAAQVSRVCERARTHGSGRFGLDLELVVDPASAVWLVQARPLTAPLHPGWDTFSRAVAEQRAGAPVALDGLLTLDAEHNPAPLSPAHAWLMDWLRTQRPRAGDPVVLAGWLYVRVLPRQLEGAHAGAGVHDTLARLRDEHLPRMRAAYTQLLHELETTELGALGSALDHALALFLDMIDCYLCELVPARRAYAGPRAADPAAPLTLRDREAFLDVLPAAWDLASPALAELIPRPAPVLSRPSLPIPSDPAAAATLLAEWDDHLFALGLAPLRAVYLRAGVLLGLLPRDAFMLTVDELRALAGDAPRDALPATVRTRAETWRRQGTLRPPMRLWGGRPLPPAAGSRMRGVPIGDRFSGTIAVRRDLEDLIARPPGPGDVVCLPAVTAQAAVALDRVGVRALCTEYGGALSHGALMARELGLSALVGCRGCTEVPEGTRVELDTRAGRLRVLAADGAPN